MSPLDQHSVESMRVVIALVATIAVVPLIACILKINNTRKVIQNWKKCTAHLLDVDFHRGQFDGQFYMPVRYKYTYKGDEYIGTNVSIADALNKKGSATYGSLKLFEELQFAKENNHPITIRVNPDNPSQAIISNASGKETELFLWGMTAVLVSVIFFLTW